MPRSPRSRPRSRARFVETVDVNVTGTLNVLAALAQVRTGRVVAISSGRVYGPRASLTPIHEDDAKGSAGGVSDDEVGR